MTYGVLQGLICMSLELPIVDEDFENGLKLVQRIWVARHDPEEAIKEQALK